MSNLQKIGVLSIVTIIIAAGFFLFSRDTQILRDIPELEELASSPELTPTPTPKPTLQPSPTPTSTPTPEPTLQPASPDTSQGGPTPTPTPTPTSTPTPTPTPTPEPTPEPNIIIYKDSQYSPSTVTISAGTTVTFKNQSITSMWPATDVHPTHTAYPDSSIYKCGTSEANTIFDACKSIQNGDEWSFVFTQQGTWEYHDHDRSSRGGIIIVE